MRPPTTTYRLQLRPGFGFEDARGLLPYLDALGVTDLYLSPIMEARPGSAHGYDVVDPTRVREELGGEAGFIALSDAACARSMGIVLDIVPNHMSATLDNPWWRDVLTHGRASAWADAFDVDWDAPWPVGQARVLVPILGDRYGAVLERGELRLIWDEALGAALAYWDHRLPIDPRSLAPILDDARDRLVDDPANGALADGLADASRNLAALPALATVRDERPGERAARAEEALRPLGALLHEHDAARMALVAAIEGWNGAPGDPRSFDRLDALIDAQAYRPSHWQTAEHEINYRRFFNISDLAGVRQEDPRVREASHARVIDLWRQGRLSGVRVDHIDGLRDPEAYLTWLRERLASEQEPAPWVVVEKILGADELLPASWPVAGTTGYDALNALNRLMVDPTGLDRLSEVYGWFTHRSDSWEKLVYQKKRAVMLALFQADLRNLGRALTAIACRDRYGCDLAGAALRRAIEEVTAGLDVYRTYVRDETWTACDRARLEGAFLRARAAAPDVDPGAFDLLERVLALDVAPELRPRALDFVQRWQQLTSPVMAKGVEDTSLYVYNRLLSLNTVGGEPDAGGLTFGELHDFHARRRDRWPASMTATDTHDAKRGEDVRTRLHVLSERPDEWQLRLARWAEWNRPHRRDADGRPAPNANDEMMLYQTLVGAWPAEDDDDAVDSFRRRVEAYMVKAIREAKERTSWHDQHPAYEDAVVAFTHAALDDPDGAFYADLRAFQSEIAFFGALSSLAQVILKIATPGVPDIYQGTELWTLNLVDPDNRRPVDYERRRRALEVIRATPEADLPSLAADLLASWRDGRVKLFVTHRALLHRRAHPDIYLAGDYRPIVPSHGARPHVCAFSRERDGAQVLCAAGLRLASRVQAGQAPLGEVWRGESLPLPPGAARRWRSALTGEIVEATDRDGGLALPLEDVFATLPVALVSPLSQAPNVPARAGQGE